MADAQTPTAVVLAAGRGTRMKSDLPKVLFPVLGRAMIHWVLDALEAAGIEQSIVVVGYQADKVRAELADRPGVQFALQEQQLGTGHAVQMCRGHLESHPGPVLVVAGDSPLIQPQSIRELTAHFRAEGDYACLLGTLMKDDPTGLGRIVREPSGRFVGIVEHKDASDEQLAIREVNMSTYLFDCAALLDALQRLSNDNAQGEFYLTDCPALLLESGRRVDALPVLRPCEALSINTVDELKIVEAKMREMGYADHA
ncbi:MAG: glycosyl transferase family 2 [Planctomycetota bacterium]|nr:MAG: glycosyl transferase family 2 [Planctomycetota bacterium]